LPKNTDTLANLERLEQQPNVIDAFDKSDIDKLGFEALEEYRIDRESRAEWEQNARAAMKAVLQEKTDKNYPWPNASNVRVPLLTTAALQFAARAYPAIVQTPKMVRMEIIGKDTDQKKQERAERVETHMSYQLQKEMKGWEADTDTMLHQLPVIGCAFRKAFYNSDLKRPDARLVPAMDLVVNQSAVSLETVPRISHRFDLYPNEVQTRIRGGTFRDIDLTPHSGESDDEGMRPKSYDHQDSLAPHSFIEQHRYHDLDGDGYAEPWIVTIHESSEQVCRIAPNYDLRRATLNRRNELVDLPRYNYFAKYGFVPDPAGGFYDVGFGLLLRTLSDAVDTTLNQMLDSAHLQIAGGGFIGSGLNLKRSELRFSPGVFHTVNAPGGVVRDAVVHMQHPGPSDVLFNLLVMLIDFGKQVTAVQDILTGESQRAQPATTTLAQIEQGLKVFSAIYKRIFRALGDEYKILYEINARYPDQEKYLKVLDWQPPSIQPQMRGDMSAMPGQMPQEGAPPPGAEMQPPGMAPMPMGSSMPADAMMQAPSVPIMIQDYAYDDCDIYPVADSHMVTDMQKLAKAQVLLELSGHPTLGPTLNPQEIAKRVLQASNVENIAEIIPPKAGPSPVEQLNMAGMEAEVEDKKASAILKQAQAQKAMAEAGTAGMEGAPDNGPMMKAQTDAVKIENEALEKERRYSLDLVKFERESMENDRQFQAEREDAEREYQAKLIEIDHKQQLDRENAEFERSLQATQLGVDAFEADRTAAKEDERNKRADYEADRSREDEAKRAKEDGERQLTIEKLKAKSKAKPAAKK
jgi:chaperonin GroES